jgi:molybdopterin molybdotransferase
MISYLKAQQLVIEKARSFGNEKIGLGEVLGRVLAGVIVSDRDYPPFNRSMMDGYAVRLEDLEKNTCVFPVVETIYAGSTATRPALPGECYKIMTGAPVPREMDMVIQREETSEENGVMSLRPHAFSGRGKTPANGWRRFLAIARQGEDMQAGEIVIKGPHVCDPSVVGLLASLGQTELMVETLPRVALITTGNEVVPAEACPQEMQIRNSNKWVLQSLLKKCGIDVSRYSHAPDDPEILKARIQTALSNDILILSGGVSAGDADHVPAVLQALGVEPLFHKIAIKPGKPTWCGIAPSGAMVFALPGNPFSCLVNFVLLVQPFLRACWQLAEPAPIALPLAGVKKKRTSLDEFFPVRLEGSPGRLTQMPLNGSGDIRLGLSADALALHPSVSDDLAEGTPVLYYPINVVF